MSQIIDDFILFGSSVLGMSLSFVIGYYSGKHEKK